MTKANFNTCLEIGRNNEQVTTKQLQHMGFNITDVSGCIDYQGKDIDFMVKGYLGERETYFEVKRDEGIAEYGNFFFEDYAERKTGNREGWLHYCEADILCYTDPINRVIFLLCWPLTKKYVLKHGRKRRKYIPNEGCYMNGLVIKVEEAFEHGLIRGVLLIPKDELN